MGWTEKMSLGLGGRMIRVLDLGFGYYALLSRDGSGRVVNIAAHLQVSEGPLQAIIWNVQLRAWTYDPEVAGQFLLDDQYFDRRTVIDRSAAEQIAREILHTELPSDAELREICAAGLAHQQSEVHRSSE